MCGRFALSAKTSSIEKLVNKSPIKIDLIPRYNIAPSQNILSIKKDSDFEVSYLKWGLIPFWAKDKSIGNSMINARFESIDEKPTFKNLLKKKRCIVFSDGYYEWKANTNSKTKTPYFVHKKNDEVFAYAGLWDQWKNPEGEIISSATIITNSANKNLLEIHPRMPIVLNESGIQNWLTSDLDNIFDIKAILNQNSNDELEYYEVSKIVNSPANDIEECKRPA